MTGKTPPTPKKESSIDQLKAWAFPAIISLLATVMLNDIREIKADVKLLIAENNINKTKIENVERRLDRIEEKIFNSNSFSQDKSNPVRSSAAFQYFPTYAIKPDDYFKIVKRLPKVYNTEI